jgi:hypothetical protein
MKTPFILALLAIATLSAAQTNNGYTPSGVGTHGCVAGGTCYYIDITNGSDSNNGTAKATAWAHLPGMACATGNASSHSFSQTDEFILKGGETWPAACYPASISSGSASTPNGYAYPGMYIGYDPTWNTGTVTHVVVTDPGSCASGTTLSVSLTGGGGSSATATAQVETDPYAQGDLQFVTVTAAGSSYTSNPTVGFSVTGGSCTTLPTAYADIYSPILDGTGTTYGSSSGISPMFTYQVNYGTVDHLDIRNYLWYGNGNSYSGGSPVMLAMYGSHHLAENLFLHNFGAAGAATTNLVGALNDAQSTAYGGSGGTSIGLLTNSVLNNYESEVRGGCANGYGGSCTQNTAIYSDLSVTNNVINAWRAGVYTDANSTNGFLVAGNKIWAILSDPNTQHPDGVYLQGGGLTYNNILRDIYSGTAAFYVETGDGSSPNTKGFTQYLFNNLMFGIGTNGSGTSTPPIGFTSEFSSSSATGYSPTAALYAYNNSFYSNVGTTACINAGQWFGKSGTLANANIAFTLYNNFCVSSQGSGHWYAGNNSGNAGTWNGNTSPDSSGVQALIDPTATILSSSTASSDGYVAGNNYAPTTSGNPSVTFASGGNSVNLTSSCSGTVGGNSLANLCYDILGNARLSSGGWNSGAYQYQSATGVGSCTGTCVMQGTYAIN